MPDRITVKRFIEETRADLSSPVTSNFAEHSTLNSCRASITNLEEILDDNRTHLRNLKKSVKGLMEAGKTYVTNECLLAENLERLGMFVLSKEAEPSIGTAFLKFSVVAKELSAIMKNMLNNYNNIVLFPLESILKGDLKEVKGDLRKPFDKASKDYDAKYTKLEKEKKQQAKESGFTRTEVAPQEIAEEMEKERRYFQLQMCEYLIKVSEVKIKKGVDLAQHFVDYYHAQNTYFLECTESLDNIRSYTETLVTELKQLRINQEDEKKNLILLRDEVKETLQIDREKSLERAGYTLHGQQGDINHGTMIKGYLLKRSEGVRKVWQKRYCVVNNGQLTLAYSPNSAPNHTLNLLTCQVKGSVEKEGKKSPIFILVTHNRNYLFQAEDHSEMERWMSVLSNSRKEALEKAFGEHGNGLQKDNSTDETYDLRQRIVRVVQSLPGNDICADCDAVDPTWLSTNLGVLTCIECSGIHREMGVHVSRVRSLTLDNLGTAELLIAKAIGNGGFNEIMEATLDDDFVKPKSTSKMEERKQFIRAKYINHQYAQKLEESPSALSKGLAKAVHKKDILAVLQVFAEGVDLSAPMHDQDGKQTTSLHYSVKNNEEDTSLHIVDFLAQNTTNIDVLSDGNSALHLAASLSKSECIKVLVRAGANSTQVNIHGKTALEIAISEGHSDTTELLKSVQGGKLSHCDNVKIDWGLEQAENIYEEPCNFGDLRIDLQSEDEGIEEPVKVPATPPRSKRRPISIAAFPAQVPRNRTPAGNDVDVAPPAFNSASPSMNVIGELKKRHGLGEDLKKNLRKVAPPPPPPTSTIPMAFTAGTVYPSTQHSTFTKSHQRSNSTPHEDSPPPTPPVRGASVSRQSRTPAPVPKTRPMSPPKLASSQSTSALNRKPSKKSTLEGRPKPPMVPKPKLEDLNDSRKVTRTLSSSPPSVPPPSAPPPIARPISPPTTTIRAKSPPSIAATQPTITAVPVPTTQAQIPLNTRVTSPPTNRVVTPPAKQEATSPDLPPPPRPPKDLKSKGDESKPTGNTPPPELPPRNISPASSKPKIKRVQAVYDCDADNDDELSFTEGEIIVVSGEADPDWWMGHIEGNPKREGVFPITFVRILEKE
ncbi:arf-GAP with SH3 domain, ANK repeat and PH domain-containing protein 2-like isoform X2 [Dendronephthya gigantea]|uniref:arf-GAP with SH3 domain, ANK repeat and PH domain-containing protein 2-like isoform X2 n=1 Tax=Dendronephthya gigantea TaxID=151771 RepID=UPI00106CA5A8|nr:arf-GAP with SH3 domain, ANK repeat and PH domain-containing protein 2-like isoform X2 [Dendronephthya gigantea]